MIAQALVREHHIESLDHLHAASQLGIDTLQRLAELTLRHLRQSTRTHGTRAHSVLDGKQPSPIQADAAVSVIEESMHVLTESYRQWVSLIEAQLHVFHRTTHATYEDLQRWVPAGTEFVVETAELISETAEKTAELAAEGSAAVIEAVEETTSEAPEDTTPKTPTRRTTSTRKSA